MNDKKVTEISKRLSWLLRHGANEERLPMDTAGWAPVADVLRIARCGRDTLEEVVLRNNKSRFEYDGERVRAAQGHSLDGTPVTLEGLEASWQRYDGEDRIWHGTSVEAIEGIAREGIHRGQRTHVHLAEAVDSRVGKRANVHVMLAVSASQLREAGFEVFKSPNGVILTRHVPVGCIVALDALSKRAREEAGALRAALGGIGRPA